MNRAKPRDMDVFEILEDLVKIKSEKNQVEWLQENFSDHVPLHRVLKMNYCKSITSMLPEGEPPFRKEVTDGPTPASLWQYVKAFPMIVRSAQSIKMRMLSIENVFIEMLEAIEPVEAELVCLAKDRKINERYDFNVDVIMQAFPQLKIELAVMPVVVPKTPEEVAEGLKDQAKVIKDQVKELQKKAKELESEAKSVLK